MSEGGIWPWRQQKVVQKPTADYSHMKDPLPAPPVGMVWDHNVKTKEWKLISKKVAEAEKAVVATTATATTNHSKTHHDDDEIVVDLVPCSFEEVVVADRDTPPAAVSADEWEIIDTTVAATTPAKHRRTGGENENRSTIGDAQHDDNNNDKGSSTATSTAEGVDYVEHVVLPADTLQGLCLRYKVTAAKIRKANHFNGHSLYFAPKKLIIPLSREARQNSDRLRFQDKDSKEYKVHALVVECPSLSAIEAKTYLELSDWELSEAMVAAKADLEWEHEMATDPDSRILKGGEIRISAAEDGRSFKARGAGFGSGLSKNANKNRSTGNSSTTEKSSVTTTATATATATLVNGTSASDEEANKRTPQAAAASTAYAAAAPLLTKSTQPKDVLKASPQHGSVGVELQPLVSSTISSLSSSSSSPGTNTTTPTTTMSDANNT